MNKPYKYWTKEEEELLREVYPHKFAKELTEVFNCDVDSIYRKVAQLGIKASPEKKRRSGLMSSQSEGVKKAQFPKGHIPANKGKKMSPEQYAKCQPTMFKKGQVSKNHRNVGDERLAKDGYLEVKVAEPNVWKLKHRYLWEQTYGEIPKGWIVGFINGDKTDIRIENLKLISKEENMVNNSVHNYPKELVDIILMRGRLNRQINKRNGK